MNLKEISEKARSVHKLIINYAIPCKNCIYLENRLDLGEFRLINKKGILKNNYYINYNGNVYSKKTNKILSNTVSKHNYSSIILSRDMADYSKSGSGKYSKHEYIHVLVAEAFLGKCPKNILDKTINHIDGNPLNNIFTNLEWMERSENVSKQLNRKGVSKDISELIGLEINKNDGRSLHDIAKDLNVNYTSVLGVKLGKINPEVSKKYNLDRLVHHRISEEILDKIGNDLINGYSILEISNRYNVNVESIKSIINGHNHKNICEKYNLSIFSTKPKRIGYDKAFDIGKEIKSNTKTCKEIAKKFGVSVKTVEDIKKGSIYPEVSKKYRLYINDKMNKTISNEIYVLSKLYNFDNYKIYDLYGISRSQLYNIRNRKTTERTRDEINIAKMSLIDKGIISN